jgi:hypothetical protein
MVRRCASAFLVTALLAQPAGADDVRGWIGVGGRNALGPVYSDFGVYAMGGLWLLGEHLQPFVRVGWSQGGGDGASLDAVRFGAGLAGGTAFAKGYGWVGAAAALEGMAVFSQAGGSASFLGMVSLSVILPRGSTLGSASASFLDRSGCGTWHAARVSDVPCPACDGYRAS